MRSLQAAADRPISRIPVPADRLRARSTVADTPVESSNIFSSFPAPLLAPYSALPTSSTYRDQPITSSQQIAVSEGFTCLSETISVKMANTFYRQMQKSVHRNDRASTAISGTALHEVTFRLQGDETQTFVDPSYSPNWAPSVTCLCLSEIVLHYFGPQVNKELTIEQAFKAIPFIWDNNNREDETFIYSAFAELLTLHERTYGKAKVEVGNGLCLRLRWW